MVTSRQDLDLLNTTVDDSVPAWDWGDYVDDEKNGEFHNVWQDLQDAGS